MANFPQAGQVFFPLLDGFHPITPEDLEVYQDAIEAVQQALGAGIVNPFTGSPFFGPKASNSDVADRLDAFLESDGGLKDVVFMSGTAPLGFFSETGAGAFFGFPKTLSRGGEGIDSYTVLFTCKADGSEDEGGTEFWKVEVPAIWAVNGRSTTGLFMVARHLDGTAIDPADSTAIEWAMIVVGYEAFIEN